MQRLLQISLLTVLTPFFSKAQQPLDKLDSIHRELFLAKNDTTKMKTMYGLASFYAESNRDSALYYLEKALLIADEFKLPISRAHLLLLKSYLLQKQAKYTLSLKLCNEVLALLDDKLNEKDIYIWDGKFISQPARYREKLKISAYHQLGNTYSGVDDKAKAIHYYQKEIDIAKKLNVSDGSVTSNMNIGSIYAELNQLDSAEWYSRRALDNVERSGWRAYEGIILDDIGQLFLKKGQYDSAMYYFRQAILINRRQNNLAGESGSCNSMAELFRKTRQVDSMMFYARAALSAGVRLNSGRAMAISNEQVADAWKLKGNPDSAYIYLLLSKKMGDSLHNNYSKSIAEFQKSNFEEQIQLERETQDVIAARNRTQTLALVLGIGVLSILAFIFYRNNIQKRKANRQLESTLKDLKATQVQLIQSEKMASLGELTAGIAHEIQNPLNFVNNFSEVNKELITELLEETAKGNTDEVLGIAQDIRDNSEKINYHGKRADAIVKGMLQHSRAGSGEKEPTDLNALCDEYLRLAYHGLRAKDKSFNARFETDFDASIGKVNILPQDMGRVILNLINNAFYAVTERKQMNEQGYEPLVRVSIRKAGGKVEITVKDNGTGIPAPIREKIFQPFYTTKPTGQGTGLGLSMSYDIVTKGHGGELNVDSREGEYTVFTIILPL